jgi:AraC-like DNA-binding protein
MTRMPETPINLPNPANKASIRDGGRVLRWPHSSEARMQSSLLTTVIAYIEGQGGGQGLFPTPMGGINIVRSNEPRIPMRQVYRPSLCVVLQGAKQIHFGEHILHYGAMECLVVSVELPASGRVVDASPDTPYIGITVDLDVAVLRDVLDQMETRPVATGGSGPGAFVGKVNDALADCMQRLVKMSDTPDAIPILYPAAMRELCYHLLSGPLGGEICNLALPETSTERVARAIRLLHTNFAETLRVEKLAEEARMSASSFHQHFKALTSMTPLQFQKQLRLLEARRLMVTEAASVADAAYQVGYESASQFSREYSRSFGIAPKQDALNHQRLYVKYASRKVRVA